MLKVVKLVLKPKVTVNFASNSCCMCFMCFIYVFSPAVLQFKLQGRVKLSFSSSL